MSPSPMKTSTTTREGSSPSSQKSVHNGVRNEDNDNNNNSSDNHKVAGDEALGSGLAAFFGDFAPYQSDARDKPIGFSTGLSRLPAPTDPIENANHIEANIGVKYIGGGLKYSQWRHQEKEFLTDYLTRRLHPHSDEEVAQSGDTTSSSGSSDESGGDEEVEPESQLAMETQEPNLQQTEQGKSARKRKKRSRRGDIPFVEDCLHDLTKLEFLDLHARTLSLNLSRIEKVWRLRDTKRSGALANRSIRKPVFESCSRSRSRRPQQKLPQQLIFEEKEEDGPVAAIYKKVVHFEVEQLHIAQVGGPGGVVGGPNDLLLSSNNKRRNGGKQFQQRIKVFFYNSYATAISEWIKERQKQSGKKRKHANSPSTTNFIAATTDIVMHLSNIPAACIFPYAVDPRNWREEQDLVDYCLCIGDKSIATTRRYQNQHINDNESKIRFDSNEMEIRLMSVVTKTTTSRTTVADGNIVTNNVFDDIDVSSELILSRRTIAKDFSSSYSSEENAPEVMEGGKEKELQNCSDGLTSPLRKCWESFQNNRNRDLNNNEEGQHDNPALPNQGELASNQQPVSVLNERPPLRQLNQQRQQQQQPQDRSQATEQQSLVPTKNDDEKFVAEPMVFEGVTQRRSDSKDINYVRLGDIANMVNQSIGAGKGCNFKVNLYASIVGITPPRITKRGDWMIAATLIDESCQTPMTINIFCRKQDDLPKLIWMGDVIRIHRAALEKWYDKIQLQGLKPTQYVVIRNTRRNWQVISTAEKYFTFNRSDEERSQALWRWANQHAEENPSMKPEHCFTLEGMQHLAKDDDEKTFEHRDITVMVVQKLRYQSSGALPHGLLRVWDGSGNSPSDPLFMQPKTLNPLPDEQREAAYPRAIEQVINASQKLQSSIDTMKIPISLCGRVSNVVVWEKSHWGLIHEHIPVGTFLRLRNVHIPLRWETNNFRSIFMHDKSWMTALPTNNFEVRSLLCQHNERVCRKDNSNDYNREFSGGPAGLSQLPTWKFVGTGLSRFRNQEKANVYTGAVYVPSSKAPYRQPTTDDTNGAVQMVTVADRSGSFRVMVTQKISHELQTLRRADTSFSTPPITKALEDSDRRFLVTIRMIIVEEDEAKHFVLTNLAAID